MIKLTQHPLLQRFMKMNHPGRLEKTNPIKANSPAFFRIPASALGYAAASAKLTALARPALENLKL